MITSPHHRREASPISIASLDTGGGHPQREDYDGDRDSDGDCDSDGDGEGGWEDVAGCKEWT